MTEEQRRRGFSKKLNGLFKRARSGRPKDLVDQDSGGKKEHGAPAAQPSQTTWFDLSRRSSPTQPPHVATQAEGLPRVVRKAHNSGLSRQSRDSFGQKRDKAKAAGALNKPPSKVITTQLTKPMMVSVEHDGQDSATTIPAGAREADNGVAAAVSQNDTLSNSDNPRGDDAIAKTMSRLQRAQKLLSRMGPRDG